MEEKKPTNVHKKIERLQSTCNLQTNPPPQKKIKDGEKGLSRLKISYQQSMQVETRKQMAGKSNNTISRTAFATPMPFLFIEVRVSEFTIQNTDQEPLLVKDLFCMMTFNRMKKLSKCGSWFCRFTFLPVVMEGKPNSSSGTDRNQTGNRERGLINRKQF